jgi:hypothetical protein
MISLYIYSEGTSVEPPYPVDGRICQLQSLLHLRLCVGRRGPFCRGYEACRWHNLAEAAKKFCASYKVCVSYKVAVSLTDISKGV